MSFYKIDPNLLGCVKVLSTQKKNQDVIVFVQNYNFFRNFLINQPQIKVLGEYPFINALALNLPKAQIFDLAENCYVNYISSVMTAKTMMNSARKVIKVEELYKQGITGKGVRVAIIDTGCYPHLDFVLGKKRIIKFVDFISSKNIPYDDNGHGTFVAGVLGGNGFGSAGKYCGIAPECDLIILKALNFDGQTQAFKVLDAMQWIYENKSVYNIGVVCMSFGSTPLAKNDPLSIGANSLWDSGITVVVAVGNDGPKVGSVKSPGSSPKIITVGCADTRTNEIKIADFSSRGPIFEIAKPDLVAPGVNITSLANNTSLYTQMTGSSVSTPFVAGAVALLLQQNPDLTPNQIKAQFMNSTIKLPFDVNTCGAGLLDIEKTLLSN